MALNITLRNEKDVAVVGLKGFFSLTNEDLKRFRDAAQTSDKIVLDFSEVSRADSTGLGALVSVRQETSTIKLAGLNDQIKRLLEITRLDQFFDAHPDVRSAVESFPQGTDALRVIPRADAMPQPAHTR